MKRTLITYTIIFLLFGILLYFLSMSWMNFLFKPNLKKEVEILLNEVPRQHPLASQEQLEAFSLTVNEALKEVRLFSSHFEYYEKLAPSFRVFEDTFTYLDFWEGSLHSASVLPVLFRYRDGRVLIDEALGNILPSGSVIEAINEKPIDEIIGFYGQFVYANTQEEKGFWIVERELLNYFPEFFRENEYWIEYVHEGNHLKEQVRRIPYKEFASWKNRLATEWYKLKTEEDLMVLKIYDLSYSAQNTHEIRKVMNEILGYDKSKLLIDLTDAKGQGENYYNLQLLLSFLTDREDYLIQRQITTYNTQKDAFSVIPQKETFKGDLYFLISDYSIYPYLRALIGFCERSDTGLFIGSKPLTKGNYFSNPNTEPLYISYLIPKVCRTFNEIKTEVIEGSLYNEIYFTLDDYIKLMLFETDYSSYISETK